MKYTAALLLCLLMSLPLTAQVGGQRAFTFLELPVSAKQAALGSINVSAFGHDVNMVAANPALLNTDMDKQLSLNYIGFLSDIKQSNVTYAFNNQKLGRWAASINYLNYGDFVQRDATGQEQGNFTVNDYTFALSHARQAEAFTIGATAKMAVSSIAGNKAVGLLADIGGLFKHPEKDFTVGLAFKNIGYQVKAFDDGDRQPMPFDVQLGASYKPEHMPVRLSLTAHHLHQFDVVYLDPNATTRLDANGNEIKEEKTFGDKLARHFVVGSEFIFSKNFQVRAGYNHLRRKELRLQNKAGSAGFSVGAMVRIRAFELNYSSALYHPSGASHYITISTDTGSFLKRKNTE
ncbi:type IX secretion system protein PorQ [Pontibacter sp. H259]|uniref:type IX secretion system protein PorQ n=1 Tax=Pontibacter sp. H259 TaxID=3133421 RepID=UPI0030C312CC